MLIVVEALVTYSFNLDHPDVEHEGGVAWDDRAHAPLPVAQVGRHCDPPALPQACAHQSPVHPGYYPPVAQRHNVGGVIVKTALNS